MPELPEVETVVRGLSRHIIGQKIKSVHIPTKSSFKGVGKKAVGATIKQISRRGKGVIVELTNGMSLLIHLKMTGQLIYVPSKIPASTGMTEKRDHSRLSPRHSRAGGNLDRLNFGHPDKNFTETMPSKHTRVWFGLTKGNLYFNDQRRFGWVKLVPTSGVATDKFFTKLGLEPFNQKFTPTFLHTAIQRRPKSNIKAIILDQSLVTGLGNIYSDEALFYAGIKPTRLGRSITKAEATKLHTAIVKVLKLGIKHSGTSINTHRTPEGSMGRMQNYLAVYDRRDQSCRKCKSLIKKIRLVGRGTHYCPNCQR